MAKNYTNEDIINLALLNSKKTVETNYTVRQNLDQKQLEIELEEFKNEKFLEFSTEVEEAKNNSPIVALESTIISHGMPYPQNIEMAKS